MSLLPIRNKFRLCSATRHACRQLVLSAIRQHFQCPEVILHYCVELSRFLFSWYVVDPILRIGTTPRTDHFAPELSLDSLRQARRICTSSVILME